jgi:NAD(P)-dependent dehydrogenase (short-subunit alcohol dehydrogenase family)
MHLDGKVAVVTGASKGVGLAVVRALVEEGVTVIAGSRHGSSGLNALAEQGRVTPAEVDLSDPSGPEVLVEQADARGGLDILVNNVGAVALRPQGFLALTDADFQATFNLSFMAALRACRARCLGSPLAAAAKW